MPQFNFVYLGGGRPDNPEGGSGRIHWVMPSSAPQLLSGIRASHERTELPRRAARAQCRVSVSPRWIHWKRPWLLPGRGRSAK